MIDMKDWLQNKAEEIALIKYEREFYDLTSEQQNIVYNETINDYKDYIADSIDRARELSKFSVLRVRK